MIVNGGLKMLNSGRTRLSHANLRHPKSGFVWMDLEAFLSVLQSALKRLNRIGSSDGARDSSSL